MTVRQIADYFGVAPSTVSVVLNNRPGVRKEMREKIQQVLIENGYEIKNQDAKSVSPTQNILFIYYKSTDYLAARKDSTMSSILEGVESVCSENNYSFSLTIATPDTLDSLLLSAASQNYAGIILLGTEFYHDPTPAFFNTSIPLVILDGFFPEFPLTTVNMDNSYGIHQALSYLKENGHTQIGYIKSSIEFGCLRDRANCVYDSMHRLGLNSPYCTIEVSQESMTIQQELSAYFETCASLPSAFIADNDTIAASAIQVLLKMGYRVPEDISIIGFDDSSICTIITPYLTTIRANLEQMSRLAVMQLISDIKSSSSNFIRITVGTSLIKRQSVCPKQI